MINGQHICSPKRFSKKKFTFTIPKINTEKLLRIQQEQQTTKIYEPKNEEIRIYSTRNKEKKNFDFNIITPEFNLQYQKLRHEKTSLLRDIQNLKEGAVSAIIQKEQEIQHLKQKIEQTHHLHKFDQKTELDELYEQLGMKKYELDTLKNQYQELRNKFIFELSQKDNQVIQLGQQLQKTSNVLSQLNQNNKRIYQKISLIQTQNQNIRAQLKNSNFSIIQLKQYLSNSMFLKSSKGSQISSFKSDFIKTYQNIRTEQTVGCDNDFLQNLSLKQRIQQLQLGLNKIKDINQQQINESRQFYQQKIQNLRIKFQRQLIQKKKSIDIKYSQSSKSQQQIYTQFEQQVNEQQRQKSVKYNLRNQVCQLQYLKTQGDDNCSISSQKRRSFLIGKQGTDNESQFSLKHFKYQTLFNIKQNDIILQRSNVLISDKSLKQYKEENNKDLLQCNNTKEELKKNICLIILGTFIGGISYISYKNQQYRFFK